jgi:hypothetical protein
MALTIGPSSEKPVEVLEISAATTTFTVQQSRLGVRRGGICVAPLRGPSKHKLFTGKVSGHALTPGNYALRAIANVGNLTSIPIRARFRIAKPGRTRRGPTPGRPNKKRKGTHNVTVTGYDRVQYTTDCSLLGCANEDSSVTSVTEFKNIRVTAPVVPAIHAQASRERGRSLLGRRSALH